MIAPEIPIDEKSRLQDLYEYDILDSGQEEDYDEIVKIASEICNAPISLITIIDSERQWFKARKGIEGSETPRSESFCGHTILGNDIFIVPDASLDERFHNNPFVTGDPDVRFYAGVPLVTLGGSKIGSLCVIDTIPRQLTLQQQEVLHVLGKQVVKLMELRKKNNDLRKATELEKAQRLEVQRISATQNRIMSILAHDMRGPLGAMKSLLEMDMTAEKFKDLASAQVNVTLSLLDNIVEWGQLELTGEAGSSPQKEYFLKGLVQEILDGFSVPACLKAITLANKTEHQLQVSIDPHVIRFILRNLLTNAIKFTRGGTIFVQAEAHDKKLKIAVKDTGIGMEPGMAQQLFQGRRKISRKGTDNETGSGLGLSLIKEFIDKNHGSIEAQSEQGKGTTVAFTLHLS